jgi:glycosyltransferase involved in cell wall biosynthesis
MIRIHQIIAFLNIFLGFTVNMNIGFLYGLQIHKAGAGGSVHGYQLAKNLSECGHRLHTWYWTDPESRLLTHFRGRQIFSFLNAIDALYIRLEWAGHSAHYPLIRYLSRKRTPVIWEINGLPDEKFSYGGGEQKIQKITQRLRRYAKHIDAAVCVSEGISHYARNALDIKNTLVIPNGSDPALFRPITKSKSGNTPLKVVWIGTTKAGWHDLETMINAARILEEKNENIVFSLYGDPSHLPRDLPSNLTIKGLLAYEQLAEELPHGDIGLHLFQAEISKKLDGSPLKQFDYMAAGLALVTQPHGQRKALLEEWQAGVPVDDGAPALATTLSALAKDRRQVTVLGENGRRAVEDYFNWRRVAEQTIDLIEWLKT